MVGAGDAAEGAEDVGQTGTGVLPFVLTGVGVAIAALGALVLRDAGDSEEDDGGR